MRRPVVHVVAAMLILVVSVAVGVAVGRPEPALAASTDLLVGDSVMAGMGSTARSVLPSHVFDAKVCRRLVSTSCTYRGVRPSTALTVIRAYAGVTDRAIVVGAGYNDGSIGSAVDAVVAEARRQGVPHVVWLTYRVAGSNASIYRSHNAVLWQKAAAYPELRIADWASYSAGHSSWVAADGLHLSGSGAAAIASLIAATLAALPTPGPPPLEPSAVACIPTSGTAGDGVLVNLTPVLARGMGNGVLTADGGPVPAPASNVNFGPGTADPNVALAPVAADGRVCFRNSPDTSVHVVADELGAVDASVFTPARPDGFPDRRVDTRIDGSPVPAGGERCFDVPGAPGDAVIVNLTPVLAEGAGDGVLATSGVRAPEDASNVNYGTGSVDPNVAVAPIGHDGRVCFHASPHTSVHLVVDVLGTVDASAFTPADADGVPVRIVDTRTGGIPVPPGGRRCMDTGAAPGDAAIVNLTPVLASAAGDGLLVSSDVVTSPEASNVNYRPGSTDPNVAVAPVGSDGRVCFVASGQASVHLVADLLGTIDAGSVAWPGADAIPLRRLDTRIG